MSKELRRGRGEGEGEGGRQEEKEIPFIREFAKRITIGLNNEKAIHYRSRVW